MTLTDECHGAHEVMLALVASRYYWKCFRCLHGPWTASHSMWEPSSVSYLSWRYSLLCLAHVSERAVQVDGLSNERSMRKRF